MSNLPPLENASLLLVLAPVVPGFVPFAVSVSQHCVPPKSLLRKVWHPYQDSVGCVAVNLVVRVLPLPNKSR